MIAEKDIKAEKRGTFGSKCKLGSGGMNNAKEKKANNGFGEGRGDVLYPMGVFIPILNMKKGKLTCTPSSSESPAHSLDNLSAT